MTLVDQVVVDQMQVVQQVTPLQQPPLKEVLVEMEQPQVLVQLRLM
tara:strand:+ start:96 stop:233 length:138 start_codon:yes stop_codon:yes gene_type:complete